MKNGVQPARRDLGRAQAPLPARACWVYGWTHFAKTGQTPARLNAVSGEVQIREADGWVGCHAGAEEFFTPRSAVRRRPKGSRTRKA